jgi:hypothetical protein
MILFLSIIIVAGIAALSLGRDIQALEDRDEAERQARPDQTVQQVEELRKLLRQR